MHQHTWLDTQRNSTTATHHTSTHLRLHFLQIFPQRNEAGLPRAWRFPGSWPRVEACEGRWSAWQWLPEGQLTCFQSAPPQGVGHEAWKCEPPTECHTRVRLRPNMFPHTCAQRDSSCASDARPASVICSALRCTRCRSSCRHTNSCGTTQHPSPSTQQAQAPFNVCQHGQQTTKQATKLT